MIYTDDNYILSTMKQRNPDSHKGNFGKVLIFAGSVGMAGAAVLCGRSALKSGAGLVQYLLPSFDSPLLNILQISVPEATCITMDSLKASSGLSPRDSSSIPDFNGFSAIAAGSGLGISRENKEILRSIIKHFHGTLVLDADALNMMADDASLADTVRRSSSDIIITPHIGEAKRLLHTCEGIQGTESRINAAASLAEKYSCIAVLKGAGTLIAEHHKDKRPGFDIFENTTGNPGMATAGSGDSLTGLIASLAGQGYTPMNAARMGVFFHGKAGDLAAGELGEPGVTSSDIVRYIPYAVRNYYSRLQ
ncbi:MAG: NAD(P)H-hydrate dehydratase [Parasporobacterium sp.]|nr:NAD(P)H-hydrate dehydratase [Parasporobacterium sp.]